jgi:phosphopantothenate---cysteine ligase (CTP)
VKAPKTILITAGGTTVPIDDVRVIGNTARGTFPAQLAEASLKAGYFVHYVHARSAEKPFFRDCRFDPLKPSKEEFARLETIQNDISKYQPHCTFHEFETYDDYSDLLKHLISTTPIDIAFLAAAVSDYGVEKKEGKISSSKELLHLTLKKNPKIIQQLKKWTKKPFFQVGFKLTVGLTPTELVEVGYKSGIENHSDLTVANDLVSLRTHSDSRKMVTSERGIISLDGSDVAQDLLNFAIRRTLVTHFKTVIVGEETVEKTVFQEMRKACAVLAGKQMMPLFYEGSTASHGSISIRHKREGFYITARSSSKMELKPEDIIHVTRVDWDKREIYIKSLHGRKASLNAVLTARIFESQPGVNILIHTHTFASEFPQTEFPETPGTLEYAQAPIPLLKDSRIVNLINHGLIATGQDLQETMDNVLTYSHA